MICKIAGQPAGGNMSKEVQLAREDSKKMACIAIKALEDKKAEDIQVIDISGVSVIADYFIIANGTNISQIQALSDNVTEMLGREGYEVRDTEGYNTANWVLLDFGDIIVHIFDQQNRVFYDLERIWRDGRKIDVGEFKDSTDK
jgi:ribosome-associated protein